MCRKLLCLLSTKHFIFYVTVLKTVRGGGGWYFTRDVSEECQKLHNHICNELGSIEVFVLDVFSFYSPLSFLFWVETHKSTFLCLQDVVLCKNTQLKTED